MDQVLVRLMPRCIERSASSSSSARTEFCDLNRAKLVQEKDAAGQSHLARGPTLKAAVAGRLRRDYYSLTYFVAVFIRHLSSRFVVNR